VFSQEACCSSESLALPIANSKAAAVVVPAIVTAPVTAPAVVSRERMQELVFAGNAMAGLLGDLELSGPLKKIAERQVSDWRALLEDFK
jgi:hypothetical protein